MKPNEGNEEAISEYLVRLQTLQRNEGYALLMDQVRDMTRMAFGQLEAATDPTSMAKHVGMVMALREVSSWVDREIQAFMDAEQKIRDSRKK